MKLIVGLGNPGKEYEGTRHNAGFMFVDALTECKELTPSGQVLKFKKEDKFDALIANTTVKGEKIVLAKPQTYMNLSGKSVRKLMDFYKAKACDLVIISDDVDLPVGVFRVRKEGSSGGQKGLENIIKEVGSDNFVRIRIGISNGEKVNNWETINYVLSRFSERQLPIIKEVIGKAIDFLSEFFGSEKEIPAHTYEVTPKESRLEK